MIINKKFIDVCHVSETFIRTPHWWYESPKKEKDLDNKDFGAGFYMCEASDQSYPIELYSGFDYKSVVLNEYTLDLTGLWTLHLRVNLVWVLVIAAHRHENAGNTMAGRRKWWLLRDSIRNEVKRYDIVIGPISDDRMYSVLDDFVDNKVSEEYVVDAVNYMRYPMQYVSKTDMADKKIVYVTHRALTSEELQVARETKESAEEEMWITMTGRRRLERLAVKQGNVRGRLFSELVDSCFIDTENVTDEEKKVYLSKLVKRWMINGAC